MQSKRLGRNAANPEFHSLDSDFDKAGIRPIFLGREVASVGVFLPKRSDLEHILDEPGSTCKARKAVVTIVLKNESDGGSVPQICNLARPAVRQKPNDPVIIVFARKQPPHRPRANAFIATADQPAILYAGDNLLRTGQHPFDVHGLICVLGTLDFHPRLLNGVQSHNSC